MDRESDGGWAMDESFVGLPSTTSMYRFEGRGKEGTKQRRKRWKTCIHDNKRHKCGGGDH